MIRSLPIVAYCTIHVKTTKDKDVYSGVYLCLLSSCVDVCATVSADLGTQGFSLLTSLQKLRTTTSEKAKSFLSASHVLLRPCSMEQTFARD